MLTSTQIGSRELDRRHHDGIDVQLLWSPLNGQVSISLTDQRAGESLTFDVPAADALDAFHHPYPYAYSYRALALAA